ncbi:uncharacterized protein EI97DRAFT_454027 [Westerdykella ornata]|uniref:Uncharacterized protein n=1 Tax=Westerdykella ornata TaxID=318751 RepID=A0A6A6JVY4_WESOR|nr:uncharacterized protein EI97DRAFT_454027 [Westerdykella ornata]KAF2280780.1 hypothetical protein EI97DRAFT_454027 [Westerdykella ornata]
MSDGLSIGGAGRVAWCGSQLPRPFSSTPREKLPKLLASFTTQPAPHHHHTTRLRTLYRSSALLQGACDILLSVPGSGRNADLVPDDGFAPELQYPTLTTPPATRGFVPLPSISGQKEVVAAIAMPSDRNLQASPSSAGPWSLGARTAVKGSLRAPTGTAVRSPWTANGANLLPVLLWARYTP